MAVWKVTVQLEAPAETLTIQNAGTAPVPSGEFIKVAESAGGYNREHTWPARRVVKVMYDRVSA